MEKKELKKYSVKTKFFRAIKAGSSNLINSSIQITFLVNIF